ARTRRARRRSTPKSRPLDPNWAGSTTDDRDAWHCRRPTRPATMTSADALVDVPERRQTMEFAISLGLGGWILLIVGALLFGVVAQFVGETRTGFEWLVDGIAAAIGALAASEFIVSWRTFEPTWDGLALVPALLGG